LINGKCLTCPTCTTPDIGGTYCAAGGSWPGASCPFYAAPPLPNCASNQIVNAMNQC
jgi:hypothetical protein